MWYLVASFFCVMVFGWLGQRSIAEAWSIGLSVAVFDLGVCAQASHTPVPSREGRLGCCF